MEAEADMSTLAWGSSWRLVVSLVLVPEVCSLPRAAAWTVDIDTR